VSEDGIPTRGLWPSRSQDLSFCHFYLWRNLKGKVYKSNPHSTGVGREGVSNTTATPVVGKGIAVAEKYLFHSKLLSGFLYG
jgi:hypothetical protein